jgi:hypothetical protein
VSDVLQFGDLQLRRRRSGFASTNKVESCPHSHVQLDDDGDIVKCLQCDRQLSAYWVLRRFVEFFLQEKRSLATERERLTEITQNNIQLIAARRIEKQWRRRTSLPACPHCHRGILPSDQLFSISRDIELRRRKVEEDAKRSQ